MKKLSLVLATAGLTASLGAFAAIPTDAAPFQLVVPCLKSGIDITLEGLLLKPTNSDLDFATSGSASTITSLANLTSISTGSANVQSINPDYDFGFRVGLGYTFPESGNDVQLSWTHFDSDNDGDFNDHGNNNIDSFTLGPNSVLVSRLTGATFRTFAPVALVPGLFPNVLTSAVGAASSTVETRLDAVDLDVGQYIDVGTRLRMRLFGGLRFARVSSDLSTDFLELTRTSGTAVIIIPDEPAVIVPVSGSQTMLLNEQFNSKFTGVGPRVGIDTSYHLGYCFGVTAHAALAMLVGKTDTDSSSSNSVVTVSELGATPVTTGVNRSFDYDSDDSHRIVPVIDAKLGLNYSYTFDNQSILTIEAGYQATQYIEAIDRIDATSAVVFPAVDGTVGVAAPSRTTTSSVGFSGPYLSLNWKV